ncbi:MAG: DUF429 domain-containing protein [Thermoplasmatota archaeon]
MQDLPPAVPPPNGRVVVGVDGRREGGWVAVRLRDGHLDEIREFDRFENIMAQSADAQAIGVDIPIGHEDPEGKHGGHRAADQAAKELLGERRSTIFHVPPPIVLEAQDYAAARALATARGWKMPSAQLFLGLRSRIREVAAFAGDPRVIEVHPEVSFSALRDAYGGEPLRPKDTWDGLYERLRLLHAAGLRPTRSMGGLGKASPDDVVDATAVAWTALRFMEGKALSLPAQPPVDAHTGRVIAIWR